MIPTPFAHFVLASMLVLASMRTSGGAISPADAFSMPRKADARGHRSVEPCHGRLLSGTVLAFDPLMIRSELIARIAEQNPHLYAKEVEGVVDAILDRITAALAENDRVELRDFGTFCARDREARTGRNPRTGKQLRSPARSSAR